MRKPAFCLCENKDADQLRGDHDADQRLYFRYTDSTIPLLLKSGISSLYSHLLWLYSLVCVGPGRKLEGWFSRDAAQLLLARQRTARVINAPWQVSISLTSGSEEEGFYHIWASWSSDLDQL